MFKTARKTMIESQLETNGIGDERLLAAIAMTPRERLVCPTISGRCYVDAPLASPFGPVLDPLSEARLMQAVDLQPSETVLVIGGGGITMATTLSFLSKSVLLMTENLAAVDHARRIWMHLGITNAAPLLLDETMAILPDADAAVIAGAVTIEPHLPDRMSRCAYAYSGSFFLRQRVDSSTVQTKFIGQGQIPYLAEKRLQPQPNRFCF